MSDDNQTEQSALDVVNRATARIKQLEQEIVAAAELTGTHIRSREGICVDLALSIGRLKHEKEKFEAEQNALLERDIPELEEKCEKLEGELRRVVAITLSDTPEHHHLRGDHVDPDDSCSMCVLQDERDQLRSWLRAMCNVTAGLPNIRKLAVESMIRKRTAPPAVQNPSPKGDNNAS